VDSGPVCVRYDEKPIGLWIGMPPEEPVRATLDGHPIAWNPKRVERGSWATVEAAADARMLELVFPERSASWSLALSSERPSTLLQQARALGPAKRGAFLDEHKYDFAGSERAWWLGERARAAWATGDESVEPAVLIGQAIEEHLVLGHLSEAVRDTYNHSWQLTVRGRPLRAREVLEAVPEAPTGHQESSFYMHYHEGLLDLFAGDFRGSTLHLEGARDLAQRMQDSKFEHMAMSPLADGLERAGRHAEAFRLWAAPLAMGGSDDPCEHARQLNSYAWWLLQAHQAGLDVNTYHAQEQLDVSLDPLLLLRQARGRIHEGCSAELDRRWPGLGLHILQNLSLSMLLAAAAQPPTAPQRSATLKEAEIYLERAKQEYPMRDVLADLAITDTRGRILLLQGRCRAPRRLVPATRHLTGLCRPLADPPTSKSGNAAL